MNAPLPPGGRREFIANFVLGIASFLGLGTLGVRFLEYLYPAVPPEELIEVAVARRDQIPDHGGLVVNVPAGHVALVQSGEEVRAFSAVCTHLGCIVKWEPSMGHLFCPCHRGMFDLKGRVVGGPPPRPLERFPVAVRNGQVFVTVKIRPRATSA